jgi:hypothetical protein
MATLVAVNVVMPEDVVAWANGSAGHSGRHQPE